MPARDPGREERISMEIMVDAYGAEEQALGWYYYLEQQLAFPFAAKCILKRSTSPLKVGEKVQVVGMPSEEDCMHEMFVEIRWNKTTLAVPLAQLESLEDDEDTQQAVADWHYWLAQGYEFG